MELGDLLKLLETFEKSDFTELKVKLKGDSLSVSRLKEKPERKHKPGKTGSANESDASASNEQAPVLSSGPVSYAPADKDSLDAVYTEVTSPIVGSFYSRPAEGEKSFVSVGDLVKKGDTLCIIEAMKIMNEIKSPYSGMIMAVLPKDGEMVDFGKALFQIKED